MPKVPDYYTALGLDDPTIASPEDIVAAYKAISQKDINRAFKKASVKYLLTRMSATKKPLRSSSFSSRPGITFLILRASKSTMPISKLT